MYSNRSEYSQRRPSYNDRSSRSWDEYEDRRPPHRDSQRDSYHKYGGDGLGHAERRSREYSDSPTRQYGKDSYNADWSRKSPLKRRMTSPVWDRSEKRRGGEYADDEESDYRFKCEPQENIYRQSVDSFKDAYPQDKDFNYRETARDPRYPNQPQDFSTQMRCGDVTYRPPLASHRDKNSPDRSWDRSPDRSTKSHAILRKMSGPPASSTYDDEDYHQASTKFWLNGSTKEIPSSRQSFESEVTSQYAAVPPQKSTKGFQRFLDVLNKGVNVDTLTKIVTQTSKEAQGQPSSLKPGGQSKSPSTMEKVTLTPEDQHKRKQIQDVLHAIGMDLGFDELGKMSSRIQERLYGRKNDYDQGHKAGGREDGRRHPLSPRRRSRSSSSSQSSGTPRARGAKGDSHSAQRDSTKVRSVEYDHKTRSSSNRDAPNFESNSQERAAASHPYPPPASMMPTYSPVHCPPLQYPPLSLPLPPPILPNLPPGPFFPPPNPFLHYPVMPPAFLPPQVMPPYFSNPVPSHTAQKAKPVQRERCLQVIKTKPR